MTAEGGGMTSLTDVSQESPREACANLAMVFRALAAEGLGHSSSTYVARLYDWATRLERACAQLDQERVRVAAAEQDTRRLREFFEKCWDHARDGTDVEGFDVQEWGKQLGLLKPVEATAPCGEGCYCAEYYGEFPATCYRIAPAEQSPPAGPWRAISHPAKEGGEMVHWVERPRDGKIRVLYFDSEAEALAVRDALNRLWGAVPPTERKL